MNHLPEETEENKEEMMQLLSECYEKMAFKHLALGLIGRLSSLYQMGYLVVAVILTCYAMSSYGFGAFLLPVLLDAILYVGCSWGSMGIMSLIVKDDPLFETDEDDLDLKTPQGYLMFKYFEIVYALDDSVFMFILLLVINGCHYLLCYQAMLFKFGCLAIVLGAIELLYRIHQYYKMRTLLAEEEV